MCFSAGASFGASAIVAVGGIISTRQIKFKKQIMFAVIPFIFSLQQLIEGFVWLTLTGKEYRHWQIVPITMFLFLAQVVWPVWVPLSILKIEEHAGRRTGLKILFFLSCILAPLQAYRLFFYPSSAQLTPHHIHYALDFSIPYFGLILNVFYFMTTIVPPFFSSRKAVVVLGALNLVSFIITAIFFERDVVSVWCFFAALISWQVIQAMKNSKVGPTLTQPSIR